MFKKGITSLTIFFSFLFLQGQESDIKNYEPPSSRFKSLALQTHKEKLRFGIQDDYGIKPDGTFYDLGPEESAIIDKKRREHQYAKHGFIELLKMTFQDEMYSAMDRKLFTPKTSKMYDKELKSYTAQQHMLKIANSLLTNAEMKRFFCNEKSDDCEKRFAEENYHRDGITNWGGKAANEFQRLRAYTRFVSENLDSLKEWAASLLPENKTNAFFVAKVILQEYDFENGGYWINLRNSSGNDLLVMFHDLEPLNTNERKLAHPQGIKILHAMTPEKAEVFAEKHKELFLVFDINMVIEGINNYQNAHLIVKYTLNSPVINIYTDDSLSQKIGEIDINTMTSKTQ